jgi:hypothetical protein
MGKSWTESIRMRSPAHRGLSLRPGGKVEKKEGGKVRRYEGEKGNRPLAASCP